MSWVTSLRLPPAGVTTRLVAPDIDVPVSPRPVSGSKGDEDARTGIMGQVVHRGDQRGRRDRGARQVLLLFLSLGHGGPQGPRGHAQGEGGTAQPRSAAARRLPVRAA